jgi:hypothetical protein
MGKMGTLGKFDDGTRSAIGGVAAASAESQAFQEHSLVRAAKEIRDGDKIVPRGSSGTIVHIIEGGVGFDVEFTSPEHVIISAHRSELEPV